MPDTLLEGLLKVGGISALAIGVFYLLYKQILAMRIFAKLSQAQTFVTVGFVATLVWSIAMMALLVNDDGFRAFIVGDNNVVTQGVTVQ